MKYIVIFVLFFFYGCSNPWRDVGTLTWTAINVNKVLQQGDAHLISKDGKHILIDAGHMIYAKKVLIPFLESQHVKVLDDILITHPHNDHYGGVKALIESTIAIKVIHMNLPTKKQMDTEYWGGKFEELLSIQNLAKKDHIKVVPIKMGDRLSFDKESYIEVLYVYNGIDTPVGTTDINDMSAITMIHHGKNRFLLTGDLNKKLGRYLAENAIDIEADILKAPHHGTKSFAPDSFFEKVHPKVLIVPAPKHLWWNERSKRTRNIAAKYKYETYVNGFHGHITVISDGETFKIKVEREIENILGK